MAHVIREMCIKDVENFMNLLSKIYDESEFTFIILVNTHLSIASAGQNLKLHYLPRRLIYVRK